MKMKKVNVVMGIAVRNKLELKLVLETFEETEIELFKVPTGWVVAMKDSLQTNDIRIKKLEKLGITCLCIGNRKLQAFWTGNAGEKLLQGGFLIDKCFAYCQEGKLYVEKAEKVQEIGEMMRYKYFRIEVPYGVWKFEVLPDIKFKNFSKKYLV